MTQLVNMIRQVIEFIAAKIMPIQIAGISLLGWIIALIIITAVVSFVFKQVQSTGMTSVRTGRNNNTERNRDNENG